MRRKGKVQGESPLSLPPTPTCTNLVDELQYQNVCFVRYFFLWKQNFSCTTYSQIVQAKENLKLSHGGPSQRQESGINQPIKVYVRAIIRVCGLTHRRAIKEATKAINHDWVYNPTCRLSHDIHQHVISNFL